MGQRGRFNGEDVIDIICQQEATARFIDRHLYSFFVTDELPVPEWPYNPPKDPDAVPGPPLDFKDIVKTSDNLTSTAVEIRGALKEIRELIGSDDINSVVGKATAGAEALITRIMFAAIAVIVALFAGLLGYKVALRKLG